MEELISMTDFVLEQSIKINGEKSKIISYDKIENYANFLKQPLKLDMFVTCDEDGNVLEEPKSWNDYLAYPDSFDGNIEWYELYAYEQAKEKVLFGGFKYIKELRNSGGNYTHILKKGDLEIYLQWGGFHISGKKEIKTIEDLIPYNLTLTKNTIDKHEL